MSKNSYDRGYGFNNFIILDVDRTVINGTSWFYACSYPNLLISSSNTKDFLDANRLLYENGSSKEKALFREKTLNLIENEISIDFLKIFENESKIKDGFNIDEPTTSKRLYAAGYYVAKYLVKIDDYFIKTVKIILNAVDKNTGILYLSSGYEPFIHGVVDFVNEKLDVSNKYEIIGTNVKFTNGIMQERGEYINQYIKTQIVKQIIKSGNKVLFLADDSNDDPNLFEIVRKNGGMAYRIQYEPNGLSNWINLYEILSSNDIKNFLICKCHGVSINNYLPSGLFIDWIKKRINKIGITNCNIKEYKAILKYFENIKTGISIELENIMSEFVYQKGNTIYFRSLLFYYWLPPYITMSIDTMYIKWCKLIEKSKELLNYLLLLVKYDVELIDSFEFRIVLYIVLDYIFEGLLMGLNVIEKDSINFNIIKHNEFNLINQVLQEISDYIIKIYSDKELCYESLKELLINLNKIDLANFKSINSFEQFMKELDNNYIIYCSVLNILKEMFNKNISFNCIMCLPYGGISLGYIFNSVLKEIYNVKKLPNLINCHYSSKKHSFKNKTTNNFWDCIPDYYNCSKMELMKGSRTVLVYDNNVTTFETIKQCKNELKIVGNNVYGAAVGMNYDNMSKCFSFIDNCEPLCEEWYQVLDFNPTEEYITAYNTWSTSQKGVMLENIYFNKVQNELEGEIKINNENKFEYKLCRVHNLYDLQIAGNAGVTMIGIHAVYDDKNKYYAAESKYNPILKAKLNNYPVPLYEIDSIKNMVKKIPDNIRPVIVFEKNIGVQNILKCFEIFGLNPQKTGIQIQFYITKKELKELKKNISFVIVTVGIQQKNLPLEFKKLNNILNPNSDYILLDFSKHQPDIILDNDKFVEDINKKYLLLEKYAKDTFIGKIPLLLADDTETAVMSRYISILKEHNVTVKGIDMQNAVELNSNEQRYQLVKMLNTQYQIRIRKSVKKLEEWKNFVLLQEKE